MRIRDEKILELVHRHVVVTIPVLHQEIFVGLSVNAVSQVTSRLVRQRYLASQQLFASETCYRLGAAAIRNRADRSQRQTKKLPSSRLIIEFGALQFCLGKPEKKRHRLLPDEVTELYPALPSSLRWKHPYCLVKQDGMSRLAMIRVELSPSAEAILHKHQKSFYRYREDKDFSAFVDSNQFVLVVVSPIEDVLRDLAEQIPRQRFYPACHLVYCGELKKFLPQGVFHA